MTNLSYFFLTILVLDTFDNFSSKLCELVKPKSCSKIESQIQNTCKKNFASLCVFDKKNGDRSEMEERQAAKMPDSEKPK